MWVLTEDGEELVHLVSGGRVRVVRHGTGSYGVRFFHPNWVGSATLCACDDKEHGKRIVAELAGRIAREEIVVNMKAVKDFVNDMMRREELARKFGSGA